MTTISSSTEGSILKDSKIKQNNIYSPKVNNLIQ